VVCAVWLPTLARAQTGTDVSPAIPVHPDVPTILALPDEITGVWPIGGDELMVHGVRSELYLRPRPGTPAGVEALIEVETRTLHRIFLLRVAERAEDATLRLVVPAPAAAEDAGAAAPAPARIESASPEAVAAAIEPEPAPAPAEP